MKNNLVPKVSIVCVTYNRRDLVIKCLNSCVQQDYPLLEIILVINPSQDGTEEVIQQEFPKVKTIRTHKNIGFFPALNIAIANATGDYIMTVDDDAYFKEMDAITNLIRAFQEEPMLGAVTCNLEGPNEIPIENQDQYIRQFTAGFTMMPRQVFTEWVGYYPDLFFRSAGETYVCTMLWELGRPVKLLHKVRMYHELATQGRSNSDWKFYGLRNQVLVAFMRDPWYLLAPGLLSKWCKSLIEYIKWGCFLTWVHAWLSALFYLPKTLRFRRPISWRTRKLFWKLDGDVNARKHFDVLH